MLAQTFSIRSAESGREIVFSKPVPDYFDVEIIDREFRAQMGRVWTYPNGDSLAALFRKVATQERPWPEEITWSEVESKLFVSVTCTDTKLVTFEFRFGRNFDVDDTWELTAFFSVPAGILSAIAVDATQFFLHTDRK